MTSQSPTKLNDPKINEVPKKNFRGYSLVASLAHQGLGKGNVFVTPSPNPPPLKGLASLITWPSIK